MSLWFVGAKHGQAPLACWINKNLFSSNKIWWGDNFASPQHKGLSHVERRCTLRANQLKVWRGSARRTRWLTEMYLIHHQNQASTCPETVKRPGYIITKMVLLGCVSLPRVKYPHGSTVSFWKSSRYTWRDRFNDWFNQYPTGLFNKISP